MTAPTTIAAGEPFDWSDTGEQHAAFCLHAFLCNGVCTEKVNLDGAVVVFTRPRGGETLVKIATPTGMVQLPREAMTEVALLALARLHQPGMRPTT